MSPHVHQANQQRSPLGRYKAGASAANWAGTGRVRSFPSRNSGNLHPSSAKITPNSFISRPHLAGKAAAYIPKRSRGVCVWGGQMVFIIIFKRVDFNKNYFAS